MQELHKRDSKTKQAKPMKPYEKYYENAYPEESEDTYLIQGNGKIYITLRGKEISRLATPIVVETWDNFAGRGASGSKRRRYHAEFNPSERRKAQRLHRKFYAWYLRTGNPQNLVLTPRTLVFIKRLVNFAATV